MTPVLTAAEMHQADQQAINEIGIPSLVLMENAARGSFEVIYELFEHDVEGRAMLVLCGGGNNGGDGLAIARHAAIHGMFSLCVLLVPEEKLRPDAAAQLQALSAFPEVEVLHGIESLENLAEYEFDLVLDAMLGTGSTGTPRSPIDEAIEVANNIYCPKIAVDIPTGLDSDTGEVASMAFQADATVTMAALKPGLLLGDGPDYAGELFVAHIGAPSLLYEDSHCFLLDIEAAQEGIPHVVRNRHKYNRGKALVLAGSDTMCGAAVLTASAAIKASAGLVVLGVPESAYQLAISRLPAEIMSTPLPAVNGTFATNAFDALDTTLDRYSVIALGPGLTQLESASNFAREVLRASPLPIILDADGLNAFVGRADQLLERKAPLVITPHHGEMARLLDIESAQVSADVLGTARDAAKRFDCIVVLKGAPTVVAIPSGHVWINSHGNPGMATAGSGDVLTGVLAGLLAGYNDDDGDDLLPSVLAGVYLHSVAGDLAAEHSNLHSLTASSIIEFLPQAFTEITEG